MLLLLESALGSHLAQKMNAIEVLVVIMMIIIFYDGVAQQDHSSETTQKLFQQKVVLKEEWPRIRSGVCSHGSVRREVSG